MNLSFFRQSFCFACCLLLFVACNQARHIVSDKHLKEDQAYILQRTNKVEKLTKAARALLGKPYKLGSSGPRSFDCSGFTSHVFNKINLSLPRMASDQALLGDLIDLKQVLPGDLLFFGTKKRINHVGLVTMSKKGELTLIHAASSYGITEQVLQESRYWKKQFRFARRVII